MANDPKRRTKSVDLPPKGHPNRDPITKAPGAHPVEVAVGSALGGAAAGLAAGTLAGPVGTVVGAVVGGLAGGYGGKRVGEAIDPTTKVGTSKARTARAKSAAGSRNGAKAKRPAARTKAGSARGRGKSAASARGDNRRQRGPQDRSRVNVSQQWEVDYWSKRLGVTPAQLRQAVRKAGPQVKDVRRQLAK
jgi:Protein of unknown function (DUF3606)